MTELDETIGKVENLYRSLTGQAAPELTKPHSPIPAECDPIEHVQEQMDRLTALLSGTSSQSNVSTQTWIPPLSLWESTDEILVSIDLPGIKRQALEVTSQGNVLIVAGRRPPPSTNGTKFTPLRVEHPTGAFRRAIPLPPQAKLEQATATLQDGFLLVRIPREPAPAPANTRSIPIP